MASVSMLLGGEFNGDGDGDDDWGQGLICVLCKTNDFYVEIGILYIHRDGK